MTKRKTVAEQTMETRIKRMLQTTWGVIAADAGEFLTGNRKEDRETIVEFVTDADRYRMYGQDREAADAFAKLSYKASQKLACDTFKNY